MGIPLAGIGAVLGGAGTLAQGIGSIFGGGGGSSSQSSDPYVQFAAQMAAQNNPLTATYQGLSLLQGALAGAQVGAQEAIHHLLHSSASELGKALVADLAKHSALEVLGLSGEAAAGAGAGLAGLISVFWKDK